MTTIFFDLETGGLEALDPDIQLAAVAVNDQWKELDSFEAKIQFNESEANPEALALNHYDPVAWKAEARPPPEVLWKFARFLEPYRSLELISKAKGISYLVARLAGHCVSTFDGPRLWRLAREHTIFLAAHPQMKDTLQLALWWRDGRWFRDGAPENLKLATLCKWFEIPLPEAHDALADVRASVALAKSLNQHFLGWKEEEDDGARPS